MSDAQASGAVVAAEAAAAAGVISAQAGYKLTQQALQKADAPLVFPLLGLELAAIGEGFAAYIAADAAWLLAVEETRLAAGLAARWWSA